MPRMVVECDSQQKYFWSVVWGETEKKVSR